MEIREATAADAELLYEWANDPDTRRWSFSTVPIPWDGHVEWLSRVLADPHRTLYIGENEAGPVGTVRFDWDGEGAEVSITVAPERRGQGLSRPLLAVAMGNYPHRPVIAHVKPDNAASVRLFSSWEDCSEGDVMRFRSG